MLGVYFIKALLESLRGSSPKPYRDVRPVQTPEYMRKTYTPVVEKRKLPVNVTPVFTGPKVPTGTFTEAKGTPPSAIFRK